MRAISDMDWLLVCEFLSMRLSVGDNVVMQIILKPCKL